MGTPFETLEPGEPLERPRSPLRAEDDAEVGRDGAARGLEAALRLDSVPLGGLTRRHVAWILGVVLAAMLVLAFARAIAASTAAMTQADALRQSNAELRAEVGRLRAEKELIGSPQFVRIAGRAYGYGRVDEQPFSLSPGAPSPAPVGDGGGDGDGADASPLDAWIAMFVGK